MWGRAAFLRTRTRRVDGVRADSGRDGALGLFLRLGLCALANLLWGKQVSHLHGSDMLNTLALSVAFVVAASIIHYGIHLQERGGPYAMIVISA
jgi:hypothetical protein